MIIKPEKMVFEDTNDIIDYVSRGMVPTRKNFEKVMFKVRCPDTNDKKEENQVYIPEHLFINCSESDLAYALDRVYENRRRNQKIGIAAILITIGIGCLLGGAASNNKKKEESEIPEVEINDVDYTIEQF